MSLANTKKFTELGLVPPLAKAIADALDNEGATVQWGDVQGKPTTFAPIIGTTSTTALAGDTAIPAASAVAGAALAAAGAVGASAAYARADHVHPIPGVSAGAVRGTVLIQAAQANSVAADVATLVTDFNALLAKLRTAGILTP